MRSSICNNAHVNVSNRRLHVQLLSRSACALPTLLLAISANGLTPPDFTGHWRQQTASGAQRQLDIDQNGHTLQVKTTATNSKGSRQLEVKYEIGGPQTIYKGLDGDEFRSSVHWDGSALVFNTISVRVGEKSLRRQSGVYQRTAIIFR